ncbi:hypothetical protein [Mobiluncus curtisii]|uniref:hypothetical protein n=1 Tax=Mobiluncus curtisii TaxID=2051 RepID=UPI00146FF7E7|nr:hypothetical protein [Mobiluncus curtisii]MCU9986694.1 hypothetical protein [Mobiluncus curtisii]MCV0020090.1 hypothetical protein [Mobiluncus curtisii]NMX12741.1 hypothetical protein [Mobiluncus curtisii]
MIDTATLQGTPIPTGTLILVCVLLAIFLLGVYVAERLKPWLQHQYGPTTITETSTIFFLSILAVVTILIAPTLTEDKILVFDNNTGSIQAIKGEKPIYRVLERSKTKVVSVPCVFIDREAQRRHDCTFVNLGGGSFEVWDTATFRQTHPRPDNR